jgi:hypothetical protein
MLHRYYAIIAGCALVFLASATDAAAQSGACQMGARVIDREKRNGTVVEAKGSDCRVKLEDGTVKYYLAWMLEPAGSETKDKGPVLKGSYTCVAGGGAAGTLRLVIKSDTEYADRNGKTGTYEFDAKTGRFVFKTGAWEGFYGKLLGPRKIGITSRPGGSANTICDLKT